MNITSEIVIERSISQIDEEVKRLNDGYAFLKQHHLGKVKAETICHECLLVPDNTNLLKGRIKCFCQIKKLFDLQIGILLHSPNGNECDLILAKKRLTKFDKNLGKKYAMPTSFASCTAKQKRIIIYYKIYRHFYTSVSKKIRVDLPTCMINRVRQKYPRNFSETEAMEM